MMEPYTVALTSCGRFDLLERTLASLLPRLEGPLAGILIAEDSGDRRVHDVVEQFGDSYGKIKVIVNEPPLGQIKSIDRLYSQIETEWIFHCEDDWEFFGERFIEKSFVVLKHSNRISAVTLGILSDMDVQRCRYLPAVTRSGVRYHVANDSVAGRFSGLLFGPGLRRLRDYELFAPFARFGALGSESQISEAYKALGFRVARLAEPAMRHIGDDRHVQDPTKLKAFPYRLNRSVRKRFLSLRWKLAPDKHPINIGKTRLVQRKH